MPLAPLIDTRHVPDRRKLRFHQLDDVLADARILMDAERHNRLRRLGN